jgi:iron complex outermembrane recepter protein
MSSSCLVPRSLLRSIACCLAAPALVAQVASPPSRPDPVVQLSPFRVDTTRDRGYSTANEIGASRVNIALADVPTSVVVLNEEFLKDVGAITANDAFRYVSGVNTSNLLYNGQIAVRGFQTSDGIGYIDGLPGNIALNGAAMNDFATIERVEVIKGPNGVLYGSHTPGGVIDMVTKKPLFHPATELSAVAGSWGLLRGTVDTTAPVGHGLAYRFVGMGQQGETYNHGRNDKLLLAPSVTWQITPRTQILTSFEYYNPNVGTSRSQWFSDRVGAISWFLPVSGYYDDNDENREHWVYFGNVALEQTLTDAWKLRLVVRDIQVTENKLNYAHGTYRFLNKSGAPLLTSAGAAATASNYTFAEAFANPAFGDITVDRTRQLNIIKARRPGAYLDLVGDFDALGAHHKPVVSVQASEETSDTKNLLWGYSRTSVIHPVYQDDTLAHVTTPVSVNTDTFSRGRSINFGVQDNLSAFADRLNVVLGVRRDRAHQTSLNRRNGATSDTINQQTSSRAGLVYKVVPAIGVFGNWSETFTPLNGFDALGSPLRNQIGTIREAGLKADALEGRLTATVSLFDLKQNNATRTVVVNPTTGVTGALQVGYIESRGWEGDFAYQVTPSISLLAGVGSSTSKDEKGIATRGVGQGFNWKIFGKYAFLHESLKGLSVGAGYVYNNRSPGDGNASFFLPDYGLLDAFVSYQRAHWRFQVNAQNVTNKLYAVGAVSGAYITAGLPREFRFSVSYSF